MKLELVSGIPYRKNKLLSLAEMDSISHYKDCGTIPYEWDYKPKRGELDSKIHIDCHIINNTMRENIDRNKLSYPDRFRFEYLSKDVSRAISKNTSPKTFTVIKGLSSTNFLKGKSKGEMFEDKGFCGYTTDINIAKTYVGTNPPVFLLQEIHEGDVVMYIDDEEHEWLFPPYTTFHIENIKRNRNIYGNRDALVYYVTRVN